MSEFSPARLAAAIGGGLAIAALCACAGLLVIGMGHGWDYPAQAGVLSFIFYPLALVRSMCITVQTAWWRDVLITALVATPIVLLLSFNGPLPNPLYFQIEGWLVLIGATALYLGIGAMLARADWAAAWGDISLLGFGIALDIAAFGDLSTSMFPNIGGIVLIPWLILWAGWQIVTAAALVRHIRAR